MNEWQAAVLIAFCCLVVYGVGFLHGRVYQRHLCEMEQERLELLEPPPRTQGAPANMSEPPSEVREPRWRNGSFR